jgi:2-polyprenyl-3-methyl-5-hydroxy-6-metoxy-1,4-benzoquinol methylase
MGSWLSYWNSPNKSYVNERHKQAHYAVVFEGVRPYLPGARGIVLDWGCSDALAATRVADLCGTVLLYDVANSTRERLKLSYRNHPRIRVLDRADLDAIAKESIDLIVVNSVIQYLSQPQFDELLDNVRGLLKPDGVLLLGDVITPGTGNSRHVATFLRFAWRQKFLLAALAGLIQTYTSEYRNLQRELGLTAYAPEAMQKTLKQHGFIAEKLTNNIAVSKYRSSYLARKPGSQHAPMADLK